MEIKYLQNLTIESKKIFNNFKKENVLNSDTLKLMFSPEYKYRGKKANTFLVQSLATGKPAEITAKYVFSKNIYRAIDTCYETHQYNFFDKLKNELGYKYFYIQYNLNKPHIKSMLVGFMDTVASHDAYRGLGVREDEIQIKAALDNNIKSIPRSAVGSATLYHTKMGFLPMQDNLIEVKSEFDVERYTKQLAKTSLDIKEQNFRPLIIRNLGKYYIDVNRTQAVANVAEIKDRIKEGYSATDLSYLELDAVAMKLSGQELEYWRSLIYNPHS